jgi:hypothetical protein
MLSKETLGTIPIIKSNKGPLAVRYLPMMTLLINLHENQLAGFNSGE